MNRHVLIASGEQIGESRQEGYVMKKGYEAPVVRELGSLAELTGQVFNKVGSTPDVFTAETGGAVVGSLVGL